MSRALTQLRPPPVDICLTWTSSSRESDRTNMVCCREWKVFYGFGLRVEVTGSKKLVRLFGDCDDQNKTRLSSLLFSTHTTSVFHRTPCWCQRENQNGIGICFLKSLLNYRILLRPLSRNTRVSPIPRQIMRSIRPRLTMILATPFLIRRAKRFATDGPTSDSISSTIAALYLGRGKIFRTVFSGHRAKSHSHKATNKAK